MACGKHTASTDSIVLHVVRRNRWHFKNNRRNLWSEVGWLRKSCCFSEQRSTQSAWKQCGMDYRAMPMVVLGGGASILARHVSPRAGLCGLFTLENDKRNAQGFQRLCERMSAGREVAE